MANYNNYIDKQSFIHRLNPSLKIISFVFIIITVFLPTGLFGQAFLLIFVFFIWFLAKLPWRTFKPILKSVIVMFLLLFFINWLSYKSPGLSVDIDKNTTALFGIKWPWNWSNNWFNISGYNCAHGLLWGGQIGPHEWYDPNTNMSKITNDTYASHIYGVVYDGKEKIGYIVLWFNAKSYCLSSNVFIYSIYVTLKILVIIMVMTILTSTTTSTQLSFAVEDILSPLRFLRLPVNEWAMTISIAIRFVPSLLQEAQKILNAQASRGIDFHNGKFNEKVKALISLVVPMFSIAFYKADDLANAMEARAYNPRYIRTRYRSYIIKRYDWLILFFSALIFAFFVFYVTQHFYFDALGWPEIILNYDS